MYRVPVRPQRSPGAPRASGRFPSSASCWSFPGARSPYGGSGHRGRSPRGCTAYSPVSSVYSPGSNRGYRDGSLVAFGSESRGFRDSPAEFGSKSRGFRDSPAEFGSKSRGSGDSPAGFCSGGRRFGGPMWRRGGVFRRPQALSPALAHNFQSGSSDGSVEKYFSPLMLQDPWAALQPVAASDRQTT